MHFQEPQTSNRHHKAWYIRGCRGDAVETTRLNTATDLLTSVATLAGNNQRPVYRDASHMACHITNFQHPDRASPVVTPDPTSYNPNHAPSAWALHLEPSHIHHRPHTSPGVHRTDPPKSKKGRSPRIFLSPSRPLS